jgi:fumarylacetoacetate (FAA) hydrolase
MKLASYDDGSRDGHLVVVSRDLSSAHYATGIATRLQQVLDDWAFMAPQLEALAASLNQGKARHAFPFEAKRCLAPLPRCHHWVSANAWPDPQASLPAGPELQRGAGDALLGPHTRVAMPENAGLDCEAQWVMVVDGLPQASSSGDALERVRLLGLAATWWLRHVQQASLAQVGGSPSVLHAWPASSFSPVLATPDELGDAWRGGRLRRSLAVQVRGQALGPCEAGQGMAWHGGQVLAWLARQQALGAGTLVGMGPVRPQPTRPGACCLRDAPSAEPPAWLAPGDAVHIDMRDREGQSLFGAIELTVGGLAEELS